MKELEFLELQEVSMQAKSQVLFYSNLKPTKILGKLYTPKRNSNYIVKAFDENGREIPPLVKSSFEF